MADREIILLHETAGQSWLRDMSSVAGFIALIGIGVLLDSTAMQWTGAVLGFLVIIGRMMRVFKDSRVTIAEARKRLDELEAE
jgi:uncharacterized iron-regulated membrane protein